MKKLSIIIMSLLLILFIDRHQPMFVFGNGDGTEDPDPIVSEFEYKKGWVYGKIEYLHDVLSPRDYFMLLRAHPEAKIPRIDGGYATTDVYVTVRLRDVSTPRELHAAENRHRPHIYVDRERQRWNKGMQYVWNLMQPNRTFRVGNFHVLVPDEVLEADIEVLLGGSWLNLANVMRNDGIARMPVPEFEWDWGSRSVGPINPNIPK